MELTQIAIIVAGTLIVLTLVVIALFNVHSIGKLDGNIATTRKLYVINNQFSCVARDAVRLLSIALDEKRKEEFDKQRRHLNQNYMQLWTNVTNLTTSDPVEITSYDKEQDGNRA